MATSKIKRFAVLLLLCSTVFIGFYCSTGPEPISIIKGTVTNSITGAAVDSAQIVVGDTITSTKIFYSDQQGKYEAYPDTVGTVQVFCRKETYQTKMITVDLAVNQFVYENVNFELVKD